MPLMAEKPTGKTFELPSEGTVQAVIAEVKDLGMLDTVYNGIAKKTRKIQIRYQLAELDTDGQPKRVYERLTLSLHEKSQLYKRIKGLYGKEPPATFDVEKLVGFNCLLVIVHNAGQGKDGQPKTYANIAATLKLPPNTPKLEIVAIPKKDEVKAAVAPTLKQAVARPVTEADPIDDDSIPF